ncbi:MAG: 16S rRNA (guanine(527)-N(7))-methyltransferase RsmG [Lachnospiraceae bacterium]|nr:16S rRNA (guanine(527)-N(7))-methyltransferase RsmG [Lachnospiraceae bacterium]
MEEKVTSKKICSVSIVPDRENAKNYIKNCFINADIILSEQQTEQFLTYYELLVEKNRVMNLTAITEFEDVAQKHFLDSVLVSVSTPSVHMSLNVKILSDNNSANNYINNGTTDNNTKTNTKTNTNTNTETNTNTNTCMRANTDAALKLIDVGSGAGFPGIPLKIVFPDLQVVLLDSLNKRVQFLNEVICKLQLSDITAVHGRAEDAAFDSSYREGFDICVSRAVANLSSLSEYCLPFVRRGGTFIAYKSAEIDQECLDAKKAIFLLGGSITSINRAQIPDTDIERSFVFIRKERGTPAKYPRKAGTPTKSPLS